MKRRTDDRLEGALLKLETQRMMKHVQKEHAAISELLSGHDGPLTPAEIAQGLDVPLTARLMAFVDALAVCGYLIRHHTQVGNAYAIRRLDANCHAGPLLPLPYHLFERYPDDDQSN